MKKICVYIAGILTTALVMGACGSNNGDNKQNADVSPEANANKVPQLEEYEEAVGAVDDVMSIEQALELGVIKVKDNIIFSESLPVIVDFYADWCGPCKAYAPTFDKIAEQFAGAAIFIRVNTDNNEALAKAYKISSIPCTYFIGTEGAVLGKVAGQISEDQLASYVNQAIETNSTQDMSL